MLKKQPPTLIEKMRALNVPALTTLADDLDVAVTEYARDSEVSKLRRMLSAWAVARRAYCAATGEAII